MSVEVQSDRPRRIFELPRKPEQAVELLTPVLGHVDPGEELVHDLLPDHVRKHDRVRASVQDARRRLVGQIDSLVDVRVNPIVLRDDAAEGQDVCSPAGSERSALKIDTD
jgi:hypothetical protein